LREWTTGCEQDRSSHQGNGVWYRYRRHTELADDDGISRDDSGEISGEPGRRDLLVGVGRDAVSRGEQYTGQRINLELRPARRYGAVKPGGLTAAIRDITAAVRAASASDVSSSLDACSCQHRAALGLPQCC